MKYDRYEMKERTITRTTIEGQQHYLAKKKKKTIRSQSHCHSKMEKWNTQNMQRIVINTLDEAKAWQIKIWCSRNQIGFEWHLISWFDRRSKKKRREEKQQFIVDEFLVFAFAYWILWTTTTTMTRWRPTDQSIKQGYLKYSYASSLFFCCCCCSYIHSW